MNEKRLKYWLALTRIRGASSLLKGLLDEFNEPEEIFAGAKAALHGHTPAFLKNLREFSGWDWVEYEIRLIMENGVSVVTYNDPGYPPLLRQIADPPCLLYAKGAMAYDMAPAIAIVGTRNPTHYGLRMAESISRDLSAAGVIVVSGMARGCDMAAHRGALSAGGLTAAVLGTGVDIAYPKENKRLYEEIAGQGQVVSEFPMSTPPAPYTFPQRNRIIGGMSMATLVIEAPLKSGALMTARFALDYNRDVLACPGQASSMKSSGSNKLIKDGAFLVESAQDVLDALSLKPGKEKNRTPDLSPDELLLYQALGDETLHIDSLVDRTGLGAGRASAALLDMELKGVVRQDPGKLFLRKF